MTSGELLLNKSLTIQGLGADNLTISGSQLSRVFEITAGKTVYLFDMTIADGMVTGTMAEGGGILNNGALTVIDCTITGNAIASGASSQPGMVEGGGVYSGNVTGSMLTLDGCFIEGNSSTESGGGIAAGGGVYAASSAMITGCMFMNNTVTDTGGDAIGGGLDAAPDDLQTLAMSGCAFTQNTATATLTGFANGGGAAIGRSATLSDDSFTTNHAVADDSSVAGGGGLYMRQPHSTRLTVTAINCVIQGNSAAAAAAGGGGLLAVGNFLTLTDCTIAQNGVTATISGVDVAIGGGIYLNASNISTLDHCTVMENSVSGSGGQASGGGIAQVGGRLTLTNCTVARNSATAQSPDFAGAFGGGIYLEIGTLELSNSTIALNEAVAQTTGGTTPLAQASGSGLRGMFGGAVTLLNCTVARNVASASSTGRTFTDGGGTSSGADQEWRFQNTIVAENTGNDTPSDVSGTIVSQGHNLIRVTDGSSGWNPDSDLTGTISAPQYAGLGDLGDHGGLTETIDLLPDSPAIMAGDPNGAPATDQRDYLRFDPPCIGAYEFGASPPGPSGLDRVAIDALALDFVLSAPPEHANPASSAAGFRAVGRIGRAERVSQLSADQLLSGGEDRMASAGTGGLPRLVGWGSPKVNEDGFLVLEIDARGW